MLPQPYRLTKRKDFREIYRSGRSIGGKLLVVKFRPNHLDHPRAGVVVSKKSVRKAAWRNKAKRRIREIIRPDILGSGSGHDLAIIVRRLSAETSYAELKKDWQDIWRKFKQ